MYVCVCVCVCVYVCVFWTYTYRVLHLVIGHECGEALGYGFGFHLLAAGGYKVVSQDLDQGGEPRLPQRTVSKETYYSVKRDLLQLSHPCIHTHAHTRITLYMTIMYGCVGAGEEREREREREREKRMSTERSTQLV